MEWLTWADVEAQAGGSSSGSFETECLWVTRFASVCIV